MALFYFIIYMIFSFYSHLKFKSTKLLLAMRRFCFVDETTLQFIRLSFQKFFYCVHTLTSLICLDLVMLCGVRSEPIFNFFLSEYPIV